MTSLERLLIWLCTACAMASTASSARASRASLNDSRSDLEHSLRLDDNYEVLWTLGDAHVTFEVRVATLGYVVFALSADGQFRDADVVVGWIQNGRARFQDRYGLANGESVLDAQQDYDLIDAYENDTHTVMRFRRNMLTCDLNDLNITAATTWMMYAYALEDPLSDADVTFYNNVHGAQPVYIIDRSKFTKEQDPPDVKIWDLMNFEVSVPENEDTLYWCRIFKLPPLDRKHHMIRYEPVFSNGNAAFIHHMNIYECDGEASVFEVLAATEGSRCYQPSMPPLFFNCNNVVVAWSATSKGFAYPPEAGYPMNRAGGAKFFMMETHYDNPNLQRGIVDHSGLRLFYTPHLRHHDAGVLSVGIDPNWKHIVPPGQRRVVSEAHCVADCTQQALPSRGINVFAVNLHTHLLGREVQLRHIRGDKELPALVQDANYDVRYQEYRQFNKPVNVLPGDHLISQCTYNSEGRSTITLGGLSTREETCLAYLLYWPRVDLSLCYSLPSLATILTSLGIRELKPGSDPVRIKSPPELADQTVEERLITFDWDKNFHSFQETTRRGAFRPLCWVKTQALIDGSAAPDYYAPNATKSQSDSSICLPRGTLPPRLPNLKHPHRKSGGSHPHSRNRSTTTSTTSTTSTTTTTTQKPPTTPVAAPPALSVWGQGISLNHEKSSNADDAVNDVAVIQTASEELSSWPASSASSASTASYVAVLLVILVALTTSGVHFI